MSSSCDQEEWLSASTDGTASPSMPAIPPAKRVTRSSRYQQRASSSHTSSPRSCSEVAGSPEVGGLLHVGRLIKRQEGFKRRPRERIDAPTQDSCGRPLSEEEQTRERRRITNRESARRMREKRQHATEELRSEVKQLLEANVYMSKQLQQTRDNCKRLEDESSRFEKAYNSLLQENGKISAALDEAKQPQAVTSSPRPKRPARRAPCQSEMLSALPDLSLEQLMVASGPPTAPMLDLDQVYMDEVTALARLPPSQPIPVPLHCSLDPSAWDFPLPAEPPLASRQAPSGSHQDSVFTFFPGPDLGPPPCTFSLPSEMPHHSPAHYRLS